jgi:hypothetical protein
MNLMKSKHWMAIAIGLLSGPALAVEISCPITPAYSIITEGQTLQLAAECTGGVLASIDWKMDGTSVTGVVPLTGYVDGNPVKYTTPVGLGDANETQEFTFTVVGVPANGGDTFVSTSAKVVVKPSSAVLALAKNGPGANTSKTPGACGSADGTAVSTMPTGTAQCATGSAAALAVSGPQAFTWSCLSLTGGTEASCYAVRGFTVTATDNGSPNGSISPATQGVSAGGTASVTAVPASGYSAAISGCGGTQSGNSFTTGPVTANCTVTASFTNSPQTAACGSANGVASLAAPSTGLCATGTPLGSVVSGTGQFTWTCDGPNGGTDASCAAPKQYTVTAALSGTGGTVNAPTSKTVAHNGTTTFTVTPEGTNVASASGCGASVSGNTVTTGAVTGACTVTVSFGAAAAPSACGPLPANTTVYTTANREPYVSDLDTLFDLATSAASLDSLIAANKTKSYEFSNDKAFRNGSLYNFYSTGPKDMSISACPGDFDVPTACKAMASMGPRVYWSNDGAPYVHPSYSFLNYQTCNIGTGAKFYMNIRSGTTGVSYQIRNEVLNK